jgi:SAM-dependent methyltransferase
MFEVDRPTGRLADIGCGKSLISEFAADDLVLIDESQAMLDLNLGGQEKRRINVVEMPFGNSEFDWIFAVLADPYNDIGAWLNIAKALRPDGQCVFIVPSHCWASKFRASSKSEIVGRARFDLVSGEALFLPSTILSPETQRALISNAGLHVDRVDHVYAGDLTEIKSEKISGVLGMAEAVLDIYRVRN